MADARETQHNRTPDIQQLFPAKWKQALKRFFSHLRHDAAYGARRSVSRYPLVPVHVPDNDGDPYRSRRRFAFQVRESWWTLLTAWLRYHAIQTRWDIERTLARLLHRRWTDM